MKRVNKILVGIIIFVILIFLAIMGLLIWQKNKIMNIFSSGPSQSDYTENIIMGIVEKNEGNIIILSGDQLGDNNKKYSFNINYETKIYQDFSDSDITPEKINVEDIQKGSLVIVGLSTSKNENILLAEVIHVLPSINTTDSQTQSE